MNDMQRSASSGTREWRAPSSVLRTRGPHRAAPCGGNRAEGKFSLLQTVEIARNAEIYGVCSDGASMQIEIGTSRPHAASEVSCRLRRRSLALAASSTAPVRRKHDPIAGDARPSRSPAASAGSLSAGSPVPLRRAGASPRARRAAREADGKPRVAGKWRRKGLKRLNPGREMVWSRKPRTHNIWYTGARLTRRDSR
jgi:hypothetical protein